MHSIPVSKWAFDIDIFLPYQLSFSLEICKYICVKQLLSCYIYFAILYSSLKYYLAYHFLSLVLILALAGIWANLTLRSWYYIIG